MLHGFVEFLYNSGDLQVTDEMKHAFKRDGVFVVKYEMEYVSLINSKNDKQTKLIIMCYYNADVSLSYMRKQ